MSAVFIVRFPTIGTASSGGRRAALSPWVSSFPCWEVEGGRGVPVPGRLALPCGTARCQEARWLPSGRSVALAGRRAEASCFPAVVRLWGWAHAEQPARTPAGKKISSGPGRALFLSQTLLCKWNGWRRSAGIAAHSPSCFPPFPPPAGVRAAPISGHTRPYQILSHPQALSPRVTSREP